jgi:hypothetical protein
MFVHDWLMQDWCRLILKYSRLASLGSIVSLVANVGSLQKLATPQLELATQLPYKCLSFLAVPKIAPELHIFLSKKS